MCKLTFFPVGGGDISQGSGRIGDFEASLKGEVLRELRRLPGIRVLRDPSQWEALASRPARQPSGEVGRSSKDAC